MVHLSEFDTQEKAIDQAIWYNFKYQNAGHRYGVVDGPNNNYVVCDENTANELGAKFLEIPQKDFSQWTYNDIRRIRTDDDPLHHLEYIFGLFTTTDNNILYFMLLNKMPLEKLIRYELAIRGYDERYEWVGFDKSEEIWLTGN